MTIQRGQPWGDTAEVPPGLVRVVDDMGLHRWVNQHRSVGETVPPVGITGGDLARTVGGGRTGGLGTTMMRATYDLVRVEVDDQPTVWSAAHVVARGAWLTEPLMMAMTAQFWGRFDIAPRSHPNDGKVDVLEVAADMPLRARLQARRRAVAGMHLPHPSLGMRQVAEWSADFAKRRVVWIDHLRVGTAGSLRLTVEPDAYVAYT